MTAEREAFYRYAPTRAIFVDVSFLLTIGTGLYFIIEAGIWPLGIVAGILILKILRDLSMESVIELSSDGRDLIYTRRYLLGTKLVAIPLSEVVEAENRITSMWRGNISEKLVLIAGGKEYLLHPHYSDGDPVTAMIHRDLSLLKEKARETREEAVKDSSPVEKRKPKRVKRKLWGMLQMNIDCPGCEAPVPVNGPWTELLCSTCGETISFPPESWADLLEDVAGEIAGELEQGEGSNSTIMGSFNVSMLYARMLPYCMKCKEDLTEFDEDADSVICACGNRIGLSKPPEWFGRVFPKADLLVGAGDSSDASWDPPEPVVLTCPSCGAPFDSRGESRNADCPHCGSSMFLPDDLWYHFHPVPVKKRWFVRFTGNCGS